MPQPTIRHTDIRYREPIFEAKCVNCREWLPIDLEHWTPSAGMARCKACIAVYHREWQREKRADKAWAAGVKECRRVVYRANRTERLSKTQVWRARNRDHIREYMRAYRARKRAETRVG